jgi:hypothetical protein
MSDTLFSSFLMVDAAVAARRASGGKEHERPAGSEKNARELFVTAFLRALQKAAPSGTTSSAATPRS